MTPNASKWRRCDACGFSTSTPDLFEDHRCTDMRKGLEAEGRSVRQLFPLFHSRCGAIALYSTVPVRKGMRVPRPEDLRLVDGRTPLWTPTRAMLLNRRLPKAPACPGCGGSVNRQLRSEPVRN